jgi:hypothetical protein
MHGTEERQERLLRAAFLAGAVADACAVVPLLVPWAARLLWGVAAPARLVAGYAAVLMAAWTALLVWAWRRPLERKGVAALTVFAIYGLVLVEIVAVLRGEIAAWRLAPTWVLQAGLLALFAGAYHYPALARRLLRGA